MANLGMLSGCAKQGLVVLSWRLGEYHIDPKHHVIAQTRLFDGRISVATCMSDTMIRYEKQLRAFGTHAEFSNILEILTLPHKSALPFSPKQGLKVAPRRFAERIRADRHLFFLPSETEVNTSS